MVDSIDEFVRRFPRAVRTDTGYLVSCPVPTHGNGKGDRNPSLSVRQGNGRLLFHCFAGCHIDDIMRAVGFAPSRAAKRQNRRSSRLRPTSPEMSARAMIAAQLWSFSVPIDGTPAEEYLQNTRGIDHTFTHAIRYIPLLDDRRYFDAWPAMIASVIGEEGSVGSVQITFLNTRKSPPIKVARKNVGPMKRGAVRLHPSTDVLGIAEGVETALSAAQILDIPCWASLSASRLGRIDVPSGVKRVYLLPDNDKAGTENVREAAEEYAGRGIAVTITRPPDGFNDWNEMLCQK